MKKKKRYKALLERVEKLEKQIKSNSITFVDPENKNKSVIVGIIDGKFTQDIVIQIPGTSETTNITNQPI